MKSAVIQALIDASQHEQERRELALRAAVSIHLDLPAAEGDRTGWPLFKAWCEHREITPYPARPASVAYFILENAALGIDELLRIVKSVSLVHETVADPTASGAVPLALNKIAPIEPPHSWPKAEKIRFQTLPYEVQMYLAPNEKRREKVVRQALSEAAAARRDLIQQPTQVTNGIDANATA